MNAQNSLEDMLSALTDDLLGGKHSLNLQNIHRETDEEQALVNLIFRLRDTLVDVEPSASFTAQLHNELMGTERGIVARVRHLPPRVQIAAGIMAVAGFWLILRRRLGFGGYWSTTGEVSEAIANQ